MPSPAENAATEARQAIAALTSALRSGEPMTPQLERASHKGLLAILALLAQAEAGAVTGNPTHTAGSQDIGRG